MTTPTRITVTLGGTPCEVTATREESARFRALAAKGHAQLARSQPAASPLAAEADALIGAMADDYVALADAIDAHLADEAGRAKP